MFFVAHMWFSNWVSFVRSEAKKPKEEKRSEVSLFLLVSVGVCIHRLYLRRFVDSCAALGKGRRTTIEEEGQELTTTNENLCDIYFLNSTNNYKKTKTRFTIECHSGLFVTKSLTSQKIKCIQKSMS
jgi:hypothetical protein